MIPADFERTRTNIHNKEIATAQHRNYSLLEICGYHRLIFFLCKGIFCCQRLESHASMSNLQTGVGIESQELVEASRRPRYFHGVRLVRCQNRLFDSKREPRCCHLLTAATPHVSKMSKAQGQVSPVVPQEYCSRLHLLFRCKRKWRSLTVYRMKCLSSYCIQSIKIQYLYAVRVVHMRDAFCGDNDITWLEMPT